MGQKSHKIHRCHAELWKIEKKIGINQEAHAIKSQETVWQNNGHYRQVGSKMKLSRFYKIVRKIAGLIIQKFEGQLDF